jgi:hypothetical protein
LDGVSVQLLISPEVEQAAGGRANLGRLLTGGVVASGFTCTVCAQPGRLGEAPAAVVCHLFDTPDGGTTPVFGFAHHTCSGGYVDHPGPLPSADVQRIHAYAWVDDAAGRPARAMLLVGPAARQTGLTPAGDTIDFFTSLLLTDGFTPVADLATPLPPMRGLTVVYRPGRLRVITPDKYLLYDGPPVGDQDWTQVVTRTRWVTVLAGSGLHLNDPQRDHLADLFTAIGHATVAGAQARYQTGPPAKRPAAAGRRPRRR